jgi:CRISPR-associated protein Csx10
MKAVSFLLHTQQPILATSLQGDPNSDVSFSYIPGSMIRGVLISRYLKQYSCKEPDILQNQEIQRLFFDGTTRFLNAYLFDTEKERRTLPVPLCLYKEKTQELETIYNCSNSDIKGTIKSPQRTSHSFCIIEYSSISLYSEKRRINIHNQRHRQRGKGIEGNGSVFRYDAIDTGQTFQCVILCNIDDDAPIIKSLLTSPNGDEKVNLWLGGSQSAGYGHVTVEILHGDNNDEPVWNEVKNDLELRVDSQENLVVTLLSDVILRDEWGQVSSNNQVFINTIIDLLSPDFKHLDSYSNSVIAGGFNRKWGLPLPQVSAFSSGSVFVFKIPQFPDEIKRMEFLKKLEEIENSGIGERKVDGFGRLTFNWLQDYSSFEVRLDEQKYNYKNLNNPQNLNHKSKEIAIKMAKRILRQKLDDLMLAKVNVNIPQDKKDRDSITNSQLSRLIDIATKALFNKNPDDLYQFIGKDKNSSNLTKNAREQFEKTKISGISLDKKIRRFLRDYKLDGEQATDYQNWILYAWATEHSSLVNHEGLPTISIAEQQVSLDNDLSLEYTLRLIIAIAKKIMKDKNKDEKNDEISS